MPAKEAPRTPQQSSQQETKGGLLPGEYLWTSPRTSFAGVPKLWALPMSFVGSSNTSAEESKGKGVSGHFSYHAARLGNCC